VAPRRLTKLRFTIDSTSQWATVDLLGGSLLQQSAPVVSGGAGGPYSNTGFFVQTISTARVVVDAVYDLPNAPLELRVCKNTDGVTSVRVERITDDPTTVVAVDDTRADGVWDDNHCADTLSSAVSPDALAPSYAWPRPVDDRKMTLAIYTPWSSPAAFASQPFVDQPVVPYDGSTQDGVDGMVNQAADSGVNGFVYWHNGDPESERRYDLVMHAAEQRPGFTVAGELDLGMVGGFAHGVTDEPTIEAWTRSLLSRASSPSYLRVGDRPVLFVWGTQYLSPDVWKQAISNLRSTGLNPFVVADGFDTRFGFDGYWLLNPNNVPDGQLSGWYDSWMQQARLTPDRALGSAPALWAAGISPGENDRFSGKAAWQWWNIDRENGARYDQVWQAAAATSPDWMVISSWNDFSEATYVQPSQQLGTRALDQTRAWANWFSHG
jgi:hypothetical protein